jgi:hypothetical protein
MVSFFQVVLRALARCGVIHRLLTSRPRAGIAMRLVSWKTLGSQHQRDNWIVSEMTGPASAIALRECVGRWHAPATGLKPPHLHVAQSGNVATPRSFEGVAPRVPA